MTKAKQLVPYELVRPGWEGIYTGEKVDAPNVSTDSEGNIIQWWSTWCFTDERKQWGHSNDWTDEIIYINSLQGKLGTLDSRTRKIRAHIGSFMPCDIGYPVTIDELLQAIGCGKLAEPAFHNGCWHCAMLGESKTSQPNHKQSMKIIRSILTEYLDGEPEESLLGRFVHATGFIQRTYGWLGPADALTPHQKLLMKRLLLPFHVWSCEKELPLDELQKADQEIQGKTGRGAELDGQIAALGEQPPGGIPNKHGVCDCHHNTFRYIERWLYRIGTGEKEIPSRKKGTERERIGRLSLGYSLALDKWLIGVPMQFLLLDLGHVDLGFDPRNDILRTYAYLGEDRTPVKEWLAACLWYTITYNPIFIDHDYKVALGRAQEGLIDRANAVGISIREWADSILGKKPDYR